MKLKLDQKDDITIISVSEGIEAAQVPVLKAGLKKLFQAEKTLVILDLLSIPNGVLQTQPMLDEISGLPKWGQEQGAQLAVVTTATGVGTASTREEGLKAIKSPLAGLQILEAKLQAQMRMFEQQKAEFTQKLGSGGTDNARILRRENAELKKTVAMLDSAIRKFLKKRTEPYPPDALKAKREAIDNLLGTVLVQEGSLAPKENK